MDDDNENARGAEISQMTGMPDMGNLSIGNATGTMPQPGGTLVNMSEPMEDAWSSLMKYEDPAADGAPHTTFDLMNRYQPPEGATEEDMVQFYANNPDIWHPSLKLTNEERPPLMRFPDYRKPVALDGGHPNMRIGSEGRYAHTPEERRQAQMQSGRFKPNDLYSGFPAIEDNYQTLGYPGQAYNVETGEPIDDAWSSLMKAPTPWTQKQFDNPPGGRQPWTANSRRRKIISRILSRYGSGGGLDNAPTAVERQHLGIETKQPLRLFPGQYAQYRGQQQRRRLLGAPLPFSPHGLYGERQFSPGPTGAGRLRVMPGQGGQMHSQLTTPQAPRMARGMSASTGMAAPQSMFKAELAEIRDALLKAGPALDYLHFSQLRSMLRRMKKLMEDKEHQAKAASLGLGAKDIGHRDGGTTNPTGGTETLNPEDDTKNWGAPGHLLVARGSGRSA